MEVSDAWIRPPACGGEQPVWSFWLGLIVTLVGLIAFGGFAKGKWY
jgi:hypothetical protein